jgi:protease-4
VLASEQIYREILAFRATGRPVVVSMGDMAASGGYYIAAPADEIWASPATITGSIGIFAAFPTINRALDKVGVSVDGVGTTPLSGEFRLDRPVGPGAARLLQSTINHGYEEFLERVSAGRKKSRDEVDAVAQGRVWSGRDALKLGLVDKLGGFDDAVKAAAKRASLAAGQYSLDYLEPELSWAQELAQNVKAGPLGGLVASALPVAPQEALLRSPALAPLEREALRWSRMAAPNHLYAYCFCSPF